MDISSLDISIINSSDLNYPNMNELERKQRYARNALIFKAYFDMTNKSDKDIYSYDKFGAPYFKTLENIHLSISHSNNIVVVAISKHSVGVDIEYVLKDVDYNKLANRLFNINESSKIHTLNDFYDVWTKKESYLKYLKDFKNISLKSFNVFDLYQKFIRIDKINNYIINVYSEYETEIEMIKL